MAELGNARIDEHPEGQPVDGDYFIYRDMVNGITKKTKVNPFLAGTSTGNFEWITDNDPGYQMDEVVTYGGEWYQSMIDNNLNIVPSSDFTTDPDAVGFAWLRLNRSGGLRYWDAGVFIEDDIFVFFDIEGEAHLMQLVDATRPYVSSDFQAEYLAGDWKSVTQNIVRKAADVSVVGELKLDMFRLKARKFKASITSARTWSILNAQDAQSIPSFVFTIDDLHIQTLQANWIIINPYNAEYDPVAHTWKPLAAGTYNAVFEYDPDNDKWIIEIKG